LDDASTTYLEQVVSGSPTRFLDYPKVFFSVPGEEAVSTINQPAVDLVFDGNDTLYNPVTGISELVVYMRPLDQDRSELGIFDRRLSDRKVFRPYFCWLLEPNRSLTVQRFTISACQVLANASKPLRAALFLVSDTGPTAKRFNHSTLPSNPPRNIYSE
jgi:hypothetical protein